MPYLKLQKITSLLLYHVSKGRISANRAMKIVEWAYARYERG